MNEIRKWPNVSISNYKNLTGSSVKEISTITPQGRIIRRTWVDKGIEEIEISEFIAQVLSEVD